VVRRSTFDSSRKVEDDSVISGASLPPCRLDSFTNFEGEVNLGLGERLGAILVAELGAILGRALFRQPTNEFGVCHSELNRLFLRVPENDLSECWRCRIVHVDDGVLGACDSVNGPTDQILPCRSQNLKLSRASVRH